MLAASPTERAADKGHITGLKSRRRIGSFVEPDRLIPRNISERPCRSAKSVPLMLMEGTASVVPPAGRWAYSSVIGKHVCQ